LFLWLSSPSNADPEKEEVTIGDDQWVEVPLDFTFPFYGNSYVTSFMFANGVIGFMNPNQIPGSGLVYDGLCCNSFDFTATNNNYGNYGGVRFDYVIMPWHTDLISIGTGKFYIQGDDTFQSYFWENISEYRDNTDLNTFDTTLYPTGNIRFAYQAVDIQSHSVTVAIVGDLSAGQYTQWFYNNPSTDGGVYWTSGNPLPVEIEAGQSICDVDSTASYVCTYYAEGYAEAVYAENCAANTLYDVGCPGYADAYLAQQCGISALYDSSCSGYETAYLDNQCSLDAGYSPYCPGYAAEVAEEELEYTWEDDYEEDYDFDEIEEYDDSLYNFSTFNPNPPIEEDFELEIFDSSDFLPDTDTFAGGFDIPIEDYEVSFEEVFEQLEMEMMEEFEDFSMDDFSDINMTELEMPDMEIPNMDDFPDITEIEMPEMDMEMPDPEIEEISEPEELEDLSEEPLPAEEPTSEESAPEESLEEEPTEEIELESEAADTEELNEEPEEIEEMEELEEEVEDNEQDEQQEEEETEENEGSSDEESDEGNEETEEDSDRESDADTDESEEEVSEDGLSSDDSTEDEGDGEEVMVAEVEKKEPTEAEKKKAKQKKLREIITTKLNNLAKEMGEAESLKAQQEIQNYIIALLNFNLGFNSYNSSMIDGVFYESRDMYLDKKVPENQRGLRNGLANEILHNKLVDIQYGEDYGRSRVQGN
jgi:hypothetical protein